MVAKTVSDEVIIELFRKHGSPQEVSAITGVSLRRIYSRRTQIERDHGIDLTSWKARQHKVREVLMEGSIPNSRQRIGLNIKGPVVVFSDAHYWPGESTIAHKALLEVCKQLKPVAVVANGDLYDGARISRHDPMYTAKLKLPTPREELDAVRERMTEIEKASKGAKRFWTLGNHDIRLHRYITVNAPELSDMHGVDLWSYFNAWEHGWSLEVNNNTVIKHRYHNGIHATYNNTLKSGRSMVTGHLHRLAVTPWGDYNGRRYGVDTGTLAEPHGDQFTYLENNPTPWCSGFAVLTFNDHGTLLTPEVCEVINGEAYFRGERVI